MFTTSIGDATIRITVGGIVSPEEMHKRRITYAITLPTEFGNGRTFTADDLHVVYAGDLATTEAAAYGSLLSFLSAAAEAYGRDSESSDLFPDDVSAWAHHYSEEFGMELTYDMEWMN